MAKTKKVYNFNAMRPAIVIAHNTGNRKAINKDLIDGAGIDNNYFIQWQTDEKKLQETVWNYVRLKKNSRFDKTITEDALYAARNLIYPKWKEILSCGETNKTTRELHVAESDVEDLIGFVWDFMATTNGTAEVQVSDPAFRKKVESLLGCAIAKNAVLEDGERDILSAYYKAQRSIQNAIDRLAEIKAERQAWNKRKEELDETEKAFAVYIDAQIKALDEEETAVKESKAKAEADQKKVSADAKAIELKIKLAK